jgi:hypothetical protein
VYDGDDYGRRYFNIYSFIKCRGMKEWDKEHAWRRIEEKHTEIQQKNLKGKRPFGGP